MTKQIQIFKAGKHTAMSGEAFTFSESDVRASVEAYDPEIFEAPMVVGHPSIDAPAYGWVKSLSYSEDGLINADPHQVDPAFADLVAQGKFKKVSASFYAPDSPKNPVPGVYYLKHVGFLGATAPAVKGLKPVQFSENEEGVIEFADWDQMTTAGLFRKLREFIISKFSTEEADKVLPSYEIESLQINAAQEKDEGSPRFSETPTPNLDNLNQGDEMSAEEKARLEQLEKDNARLQAENASFAEKAKVEKSAQIHKSNVEFAESLVKEGKLLPAHKDNTVALLDSNAAIEAPIEFGEGDEKTSMHPYDLLKAQLESAPKVVNFGESESGKSQNEEISDKELAERARTYREKTAAEGKNISFSEAVDAVTAGKDKSA